MKTRPGLQFTDVLPIRSWACVGDEQAQISGGQHSAARSLKHKGVTEMTQNAGLCTAKLDANLPSLACLI